MLLLSACSTVDRPLPSPVLQDAQRAPAQDAAVGKMYAAFDDESDVRHSLEGTLAQLLAMSFDQVRCKVLHLLGYTPCLCYASFLTAA